MSNPMICSVHNRVRCAPLYDCPECQPQIVRPMSHKRDLVAEANAIIRDESNQSDKALMLRAIKSLYEDRERDLRKLIPGEVSE